MDLNKFLTNPKILGTILLTIAMVIYSILGGGSTSTITGKGNNVNNNKRVDSKVSQDNLSGNAVKLGNIGTVGGSLDLSRKDNHSNKINNEGND